LFIIDEFAYLLNFSSLVTIACSSGIPKVHKDDWLDIQRRSVRHVW